MVPIGDAGSRPNSVPEPVSNSVPEPAPRLGLALLYFF